MPENIYDVLRTEQSQLIPILDQNHDVCTFLISAYTYLKDLTMTLGRKPEDMNLSVAVIMERLLKIDISWKSQHEGSSSFLASKLPRQRNLTLVSFVKSNSKIKNLAQDVIYCLERWLKEKDYRKELGYSAIKLENAIGWRDGRTITAEIVLAVDYEQAAALKMKFKTDEPEQPTKSDIILTDEMIN
jgi:hypothetical protein